MQTFNIGGVPEYFNLPIHKAIASKNLGEKNIDLKWTAVNEGTGALAKMLDDGTMDLAVILLEGATKSVLEGKNCRILKNFVTSPLVWGVHTSPTKDLDLHQLKAPRIAISRYGSGSHMMSFLLAQKYGWEIDQLNFVEINNLDGAIEAFEKDQVDLFLWEKYTTKPFVNAGKLNLTDEIKTPWPCFVIAANTRSLERFPNEIRQICEELNLWCAKMQADPELSRHIVERYQISESDAEIVAKEVKWSTDFEVDQAAIQKVMTTYESINVINNMRKPAEIIFSI
ncbi:MAG: ABC transporter substrate-binding protein [Marinoscillum sp.]